MSWKPEVNTFSDEIGMWSGNALRFATKEEADAYATDLSIRWTSVREHRSIEVSDPVNSAWSPDRGTIEIKPKGTDQ